MSVWPRDKDEVLAAAVEESRRLEQQAKQDHDNRMLPKCFLDNCRDRNTKFRRNEAEELRDRRRLRRYRENTKRTTSSQDGNGARLFRLARVHTHVGVDLVLAVLALAV